MLVLPQSRVFFSFLGALAAKPQNSNLEIYALIIPLISFFSDAPPEASWKPPTSPYMRSKLEQLPSKTSQIDKQLMCLKKAINTEVTKYVPRCNQELLACIVSIPLRSFYRGYSFLAAGLCSCLYFVTAAKTSFF